MRERAVIVMWELVLEGPWRSSSSEGRLYLMPMGRLAGCRFGVRRGMLSAYRELSVPPMTGSQMLYSHPRGPLPDGVIREADKGRGGGTDW
jgi:hypothetical protein